MQYAYSLVWFVDSWAFTILGDFFSGHYVLRFVCFLLPCVYLYLMLKRCAPLRGLHAMEFVVPDCSGHYSIFLFQVIVKSVAVFGLFSRPNWKFSFSHTHAHTHKPYPKIFEKLFDSSKHRTEQKGGGGSTKFVFKIDFPFTFFMRECCFGAVPAVATASTKSVFVCVCVCIIYVLDLKNLLIGFEFHFTTEKCHRLIRSNFALLI